MWFQQKDPQNDLLAVVFVAFNKYSGDGTKD